MSITASIVADSLSPKGCRLTTFVLEYPRFVHAELMTHRTFSKNAASSRAIPIEKMIEAVQTNPAMPVWWGKNQSGMQAKDELDDVVKHIPRRGCEMGYLTDDPTALITTKAAAQRAWLEARDIAIGSVKELVKLGLHKQIANRILEPWFHIRIILSGTEFENFFALRVHPDAQPEIQELGRQMLEAYNASEPQSLKPGEWHIPFGDQIDNERLFQSYVKELPHAKVHVNSLLEGRIKVAIARCARISYLNYEGKDDYAADIKLCDRLFGSAPRHLSPTEHVAQCLDTDTFVGNFRGWKQYRYTFADQSLSDSRVVKKAWIAS